MPTAIGTSAPSSVPFTLPVHQFNADGASSKLQSLFTKQSKVAEVIKGILGRELTGKELRGTFALEDLIDKECSMLVLQSKSKTGAVYGNVEQVFPSLI